MRLVHVEWACLLMTIIHIWINDNVDAETFTLGYITGSKRRQNDLEYQRPGSRISGAINLAVEEVGNNFVILFFVCFSHLVSHWKIILE